MIITSLLATSAWAVDFWSICLRCYPTVLITILCFVAATAVLSWSRHLLSKGKPRRYRRRTSHASAMAVNRQWLEEATGMKQNVMNVLLWFDEAPTRADFVSMMMSLATKYERMGAVPRFEDGECIWHRIGNLEAAVDKAVLVDSGYEKCADDARALGRAHVHIGTILTNQDEAGQDLPLWRVVVLSSNAVLLRIDHAISDGLSTTSLLREIGVKTSTNAPLTLSDLGPIFRAIERAGDLRIALYPLKLLWPPNLIRAVRFLAYSLSPGKEQPNPLRPLPEHMGKTVPSSCYGTVYFPSVPLGLFRDMARAMGNGTTINDILLLVVSMTFGGYMDALGKQEFADTTVLKVLLPIGNPLRPSQYGDYYDGLCNRMTPIVIPLRTPRRASNGASSFSPSLAIREIREYMIKAKISNTPTFMTALKPSVLKRPAKHSPFAVVSSLGALPSPLSLHRSMSSLAAARTA